MVGIEGTARGILALLAVLSLAACATTSANQPAAGQAKPEMRLVTGSRIAQEVDPESDAPATRQPVRIVDRQDLNRAGELNLRDALRKAAPQIDP